MKIYVNELAPWEMKNNHYQNIDLGKDVFIQRADIRNQIREMIVSQLEIASSTIASKKMINEKIDSLAYDLRNVEDGLHGLKSAFEWGISEVVWQIELNTKGINNILKVLYAPAAKLVRDLRNDAQEAFEKGQIADALVNFTELLDHFKKDFSVYISLGIIYFFYETDKEKALINFDKAIEIARSHSDYYTSYALLYKALIVRDLDHIEEAEEYSKEALDLTPDFSEAIYQNAQYNSLLNRPNIAIPLLKEVIRHDVVYCLKINKEQCFDGIRTHITKMFEEIREDLNKSIKRRMKKFDRKLYSFTGIVKTTNEHGFKVSYDFVIEHLKNDRDELAYNLHFKSIIDVQIIDYGFSEIDKNLNQDILSLIDDCKKMRARLEAQKKDATKKLLEEKKKRNFFHFLLYSTASQIYAIPIALSFSASSKAIILEVAICLSCFLLIIIIPRLKWMSIYNKLQNRQNELDGLIRKIESILFR